MRKLLCFNLKEKKGYASDFNFAKGIGMLLIMFAHSFSYYSYDNIIVLAIYAFLFYGMMPMFYMISGFGFKKRSVKSCMIQRARFLLKPYCYVTIAIAFIFPLIHFGFFRYWQDAFKEMLKEVLAFILGISYHSGFTIGNLELYDCGSMWFILSLFNAWIILNFILHISKVWIQRVLVVCCVLLGWVAALLGLCFWCLSPSFITVGYLYVGMELREHNILQRKLPKLLYVVLLIFWIIGARFGYVNMAYNLWKLGVVDILLAGVVGFLLVRIFSFLNHTDGVIVEKIREIGFYSLYIMCIHTVESICIPWYLFAEKFSKYPFLGMVLQWILRCILVFLVCYIIRKRKKILTFINNKVRLYYRLGTIILCFFFVAFFLSTRIAAFLFSWKSIHISRIWVWCIAAVLWILCFLLKRFILDYIFVRVVNNRICIITCTVLAILFNIAVTKKMHILGIVIAYEGMSLPEKGLCLLGASTLLCIFLLFICNVLHDLKYFCRKLRKIINPEKKDIFFLALMILIFTAFILFYFTKEHTIYYWDNAGYWLNARNLSELIKSQGVLKYIKEVIMSVYDLDYNYLPIVPASLIGVFINLSRKTYVLINFLVYFIPTVIILYFYFKRKSKNTFIITFLALCATPMLSYLIINGYVEVGAVSLILLSYVLIPKDDLKHDKRYFCIGLILTTCFHFRRWLAFFILSYVIVICIRLIKSKRWTSLVDLCLPVVFVIMYFTQRVVTEKMLVNYSKAYEAYNLGIFLNLGVFLIYIGVLMTLTVISYILYCMIYSKEHKLLMIVFLQSILCILFFINVQSPSTHHGLLILPGIILILGELIVDASNKHKVMFICRFLLCILVFCQIIAPFFKHIDLYDAYNKKEYLQIAGSSLFSLADYSAKKDNDADEMYNMMTWLDENIGEKGKTVGVLASSFILNRDRMLNTEISLDVPRKSDCDRNYVVWLPEIDLRDGFNSDIYECDYLLVTDPIQALGGDDLCVILYPSESILKGTDIGCSYEKVDVQFIIGDNVHVYIYKKTSEVPEKDREVIYNRLCERYPGEEKLFQK